MKEAIYYWRLKITINKILMSTQSKIPLPNYLQKLLHHTWTLYNKNMSAITWITVEAATDTILSRRADIGMKERRPLASTPPQSNI